MTNKFVELLTAGGIYSTFNINYDTIYDILDVIGGKEKLDLYCTTCHEKRIFTMEPIIYHQETTMPHLFSNENLADSLTSSIKLSLECNPDAPLNWLTWQYTNDARIIDLKFSCALNDDHIIDYIILFENDKAIKIGQLPSVADIDFPNLKKYNKSLEEQYMKEFKRAIGLHASGIGIGSFVYLRRIIEKLIYNAADTAIKDGIITKEIFEYDGERQRKVDSKIRLLKNYLPNLLVENATIYGIVSKGIHELSEDECIKYFPVIYQAILLILDDLNIKHDQERVEKELKSSIAQIASTLKK